MVANNYTTCPAQNTLVVYRMLEQKGETRKHKNDNERNMEGS